MNQLNLKRLSIRSVDEESYAKLKAMNAQLRIPMALLIEDAIQLLWDDYAASGYELSESHISV